MKNDERKKNSCKHFSFYSLDSHNVTEKWRLILGEIIFLKDN